MDTLADIKELVERAKNYDAEAFGRIYDLYFDKIFNYAYYKVGNRHEAEDIAEQVFLKALEKISGFEWRGAPFSSWLFRIASNLVIDFYRAGKYEMVDIACEEHSLYDGGCGPEESAMREHDRASVASAIKTLTEEQQQVIILRFISGMSNEEVAKAIGKNVGAVKALQHRAISALGKTLGRE
ncbi:MAG: sigma-70 family RNA polymerase sigma factor [Candidatus Aquicultor sp.]|nr:sigma-70 family RNA polymerase sigma factor [Candidatus Aquicultor sp.]